MTVLIHFHNGPLDDHIVEFETLPRKYSVVADNTLYRYQIEAANAQWIKPSTDGNADEVLRGVEITQP